MIKFEDASLEMIIVVSFLGIGLILSIVFAMENIASVIVGALAGYLTRIVKESLTHNATSTARRISKK